MSQMTPSITAHSCLLTVTMRRPIESQQLLAHHHYIGNACSVIRLNLLPLPIGAFLRKTTPSKVNSWLVALTGK